MTHGIRRIAATVALAVVLLGALGVGTGSVAFSQVGHAVNSTLAWLRQMVVGPTPGEPEITPPEFPNAKEQTPGHEITYAFRIHPVRENEAGVWQALKDQGIELVAVSTDPEVLYAALTPPQGAWLDNTITLRQLSSPRVTVTPGNMATISLTDSDAQEGRKGFALGLLPVLSNDGQEVQSTIFFHDGSSGFEIPNVSTESGGVVLLRVKGIHLPEEQESEGPLEFLIRLQVNLQ